MTALFPRLVHRLQRAGLLTSPVRGIRSTVAEWLSASEGLGRSGRCWTRPIVAAARFPKVAPEVVISDTGSAFDPAAFDSGETYLETEKFVAHFADAMVGTDNCELLTPDRWLIHELLLNDPVVKKRFVESTQSFRLGSLPRLPGKYATICSALSRTNYSHFVLDVLPRLEFLEAEPRAADAKIILPASLPAYQFELLRLMGYDESRWHLTDGKFAIYESLFAASFPHDAYWYPNPDACRRLRARLLAAVPCTRPTPARILISRKGSTFRRIVNADVIDCLTQRYGFVEVALEKLSAVEQIQLFKSASTVIAPHGAGLTNILYMPEGSTVIELAGSRHRLPTYVNLAGALGLRFGYVATSAEHETVRKNDDFIMPVERVVAALDQLNILPA